MTSRPSGGYSGQMKENLFAAALAVVVAAAFALCFFRLARKSGSAVTGREEYISDEEMSELLEGGKDEGESGQ